MREAYNKGISPREFRRCYKKDLMDVWEIDQAFGDRIERERAVQEMMQKMRTRF